MLKILPLKAGNLNQFSDLCCIDPKMDVVEINLECLFYQQLFPEKQLR